MVRSSAQVSGGHGRRIGGVCRQMEKWMGSHPNSHRTVVLCSHPPHQPEGGLQQQMPGPPFQGRAGEKEGGLTSAVNAGYLRGLSWLCSDKGEPSAGAARHPRSSERGPRAFRVSKEDGHRGGLCIQARSPTAMWPAQRGAFVQGWGAACS